MTSAKPQYYGKYYMTSNIPSSSEFHATATATCGNGLYMALGESKMIAGQRLGDNSYYTIAGVHLPEDWKAQNSTLVADSANLRDWLVSDAYANWPKQHTDLIANSEGDIYTWPLYGFSAESLGWQHQQGVTLVGDAAHVW
jgi:2-polyprenyl-6-methoxyphenol hydroxylase-like FAD-dependent oxidoreductase